MNELRRFNEGQVETCLVLEIPPYFPPTHQTSSSCCDVVKDALVIWVILNNFFKIFI